MRTVNDLFSIIMVEGMRRSACEGETGLKLERFLFKLGTFVGVPARCACANSTNASYEMSRILFPFFQWHSNFNFVGMFGQKIIEEFGVRC